MTTAEKFVERLANVQGFQNVKINRIWREIEAATVRRFWHPAANGFPPQYYLFADDSAIETAPYSSPKVVNPAFCVEHRAYFAECGRLGHNKNFDPKQTL